MRCVRSSALPIRESDRLDSGRSLRMKEVNLLESLPYDSLAAGTTTTTVTTQPYPYTKTLTVAEYYSRFFLKGKSVLLVITPTNTLYRPDTMKFIRSSANLTRAFIDDNQ